MADPGLSASPRAVSPVARAQEHEPRHPDHHSDACGGARAPSETVIASSPPRSRRCVRIRSISSGSSMLAINSPSRSSPSRLGDCRAHDRCSRSSCGSATSATRLRCARVRFVRRQAASELLRTSTREVGTIALRCPDQALLQYGLPATTKRNHCERIDQLHSKSSSSTGLQSSGQPYTRQYSTRPMSLTRSLNPGSARMSENSGDQIK